MKIKPLFAFSIASVMLFAAMKLADEIIERLGMQHQSAQWYLARNLIGRFDSGVMELGMEDGPPNSIYAQTQAFRLPRVKLDGIAGDKAAAAKELCEYVRKYINSVEFAAEYAKLREGAMPLTDRGMSLAELKRSSEVFRTNIKNYPNDTKYVAEQQKQLDDNEKKISVMLEASKKPFPGKEAWGKMYPADPAIVVKKRLQEYLQLVATVDFNAKLTGSGKRQTFLNPAYEKKSLKWKAIYRAGKDVNDVVTAFVKEWLKGEIIAKEKTTMTVAAVPADGQKPVENKNTSQPEAAVNASKAEATTADAPIEKKQNTGKLKDKLKSIIRN